MGWTHVQDNPGSGSMMAVNSAVASMNIGAYTSANAIGNIAVVLGGGSNGALTASQVTCSDNAATPNNYTQYLFYNPSQWIAIWVAVIQSLPASGNLNPVINIGGGNHSAMSGCASEFSGLSGGVLISDTSVTNSASISTGGSVSVSVTTPAAGDLLLGVAQCANTNAATWTEPAGFTKIGQESAGFGFRNADSCYDILAGIANNQTVQWSAGNLSGNSTMTVGAIALRIMGQYQAIPGGSEAMTDTDGEIFYRTLLGPSMLRRLRRQTGDDYMRVLSQINRDRRRQGRRRIAA